MTPSAFAAGITVGFLADLAFADPRGGHPVAAFGRAAGALEHLLWRDHRAAGAAHTALCVGGTGVASAALCRAARRPAVHMALIAAATWTALGGTSLRREARCVAASLERGDIATARARLPHLCGRDPQALGAGQLARAVVESVAENTSDAVVGTLVWGCLAGVPGLLAFRAVNTLDAMVGHRSPRYRRFGWAAARLDDVVGWPGARLTGALVVGAAPNRRGALRVWRRDSRAHLSPNAGHAEAAFAGALGVRLGGALTYGGRAEYRPVLGAEGRPVAVEDIERAVRLSARVSAMALGAAVLGRFAMAYAMGKRGGSGGKAGPGTKPGPGGETRAGARPTALGGVVRGRGALGGPGRITRGRSSR